MGRGQDIIQTDGPNVGSVQCRQVGPCLVSHLARWAEPRNCISYTGGPISSESFRQTGRGHDIIQTDGPNLGIV